MFLEAQSEAILDTPKILTKAIDRSQHCQRNFDLSKSIPEADMKKMVHAVTQCPSKQNVALYEAHFITNRDVIEEMHNTTQGFDYPDENGGVAYQTNSQVLANLVIVFTKLPINEKLFENEDDLENIGKLLDDAWKVKRKLADGLTNDYIDEIYEFTLISPIKKIGSFFWKKIDENTIDRFGPNGISKIIKLISNKAVQFQSGYIYDYAFVMLVGLSALITYLILNKH